MTLFISISYYFDSKVFEAITGALPNGAFVTVDPAEGTESSKQPFHAKVAQAYETGQGSVVVVATHGDGSEIHIP